MEENEGSSDGNLENPITEDDKFSIDPDETDHSEDTDENKSKNGEINLICSSKSMDLEVVKANKEDLTKSSKPNKLEEMDGKMDKIAEPEEANKTNHKVGDSNLLNSCSKNSGEEKLENDKIEDKAGKELNDKTENCNEQTAASKTDNEAASSYDPKNVHYEGELAVYTDPSTGTQYEWSAEKNEWRLREVSYNFEGDTHVYTDKDGVKYFWDKQKKAWFPKLDDDFMARYQMSYGFTEHTEEKLKEEKPIPEAEPEQPALQPKGEKRKATEPTWFEVDETENTKVYVSNLPTDITEQEFIDLMQKCGLVMRDPTNGSFKIKLYKEPSTDYLKGDALCTYIKIESVELALSLLDGSDFKGHKISVERAKFQMKGAYDPKLKPKMKKRKDKLKLKKIQEKLFDWRPEKFVGDRGKHEKVVIVKNLFDPSIFDTDVGLILEFQEDLREEVAKIGQVRKVIIYDRHPEGVAQINMSSPEEADEVVKLLNGRWFMKRQLSAEIWDGKTKFKIAETDAQISERIQNWDKFLEEDKPKAEAPAK